MNQKLGKGVLIIDDLLEDFEKISTAFEKFRWKIYPGKDDYRNVWDKIFLDKSPREITDFVQAYLEKMHRQIGVIILDILLIRDKTMDQTGIDRVLPMIRNFKPEDERFRDWGSKVPIIALTRIPPKEIARTALTSQEHVDNFFRKDTFNENPNLLVFTAHSLFSTFQLRMQEGLSGVISEKIDALFDYLELAREAIISKIDNVKIIFDGELGEVNSKLELILHGLIKQMKPDDMKKFVPEFSDEIKEALGEEPFEKIKKSLEKPSLKEEFIHCVKNGTIAEFSGFLTKTYDELCKSGAITMIPFGKFIGLGLTTILKILSK
jgi:hypothetical protein